MAAEGAQGHRGPESQGPAPAWLRTPSFTCLSLPHQSGAGKAQGKPAIGLHAHHTQQDGAATTAAVAEPVGCSRPLSPGVQGPGRGRRRGGHSRGCRGTYPGRSCRLRGAGSQACTRRGRSLACSHTCAGSHRCVLGTHPHLGRDTGPRINSQYPVLTPPTLWWPQDPQLSPLTEDIALSPDARAQTQDPPSQTRPATLPEPLTHACRSRVERRQGPSPRPGRPAQEEEPPPPGQPECGEQPGVS